LCVFVLLFFNCLEWNVLTGVKLLVQWLVMLLVDELLFRELVVVFIVFGIDWIVLYAVFTIIKLSNYFVVTIFPYLLCSPDIALIFIDLITWGVCFIVNLFFLFELRLSFIIFQLNIFFLIHKVLRMLNIMIVNSLLF